MSKVKQNAHVPLGEAMDGRIIYDYQVGNLEGRILTLIEALGFSETREKATKDLFKGVIRESLYLNCEIIQGEILNEAIRKNRESNYGSQSSVSMNSGN